MVFIQFEAVKDALGCLEFIEWIRLNRETHGRGTNRSPQYLIRIKNEDSYDLIY